HPQAKLYHSWHGNFHWYFLSTVSSGRSAPKQLESRNAKALCVPSEKLRISSWLGAVITATAKAAEAFGISSGRAEKMRCFCQKMRSQETIFLPILAIRVGFEANSMGAR